MATVRPIEFRSMPLRPVYMASVLCPWVDDFSGVKPKTQWMGITHCNACGFSRKLIVDYVKGDGEVLCDAPV